MIDAHCHVLPGMDNGCKTPEEAEQLLRTLYKQGVDTVIATPHFYRDKEDPDSFLRRRQAALESIRYDKSCMPKIILGAEVSYFFGMCHSRSLHKLCVEGTRVLMVEMPFRAWSSKQVASVCALQSFQGVMPVLTHVEQYRKRRQFFCYRSKLSEQGVCFQSNAHVFTNPFCRLWARWLIKKGDVHLLGSGAHTSSEVKMAAAACAIRRRYGKHALGRIRAISRGILQLKAR